MSAISYRTKELSPIAILGKSLALLAVSKAPMYVFRLGIIGFAEKSVFIVFT